MIIIDLQLPKVFQDFEVEVKSLLIRHQMDQAIGLDAGILANYLSNCLATQGSVVGKVMMKNIPMVKP